MDGYLLKSESQSELAPEVLEILQPHVQVRDGQLDIIEYLCGQVLHETLLLLLVILNFLEV
jgi:hypothetical protein